MDSFLDIPRIGRQSYLYKSPNIRHYSSSDQISYGKVLQTNVVKYVFEILLLIDFDQMHWILN